ncbi:MAG: hypothetical protein OQK12_09845, partial [Motiliproteus sp.]|nr:hypothetical protein [Motiliproteus sp.]
AEKAEKLLTQQLALYPDNHPITVTYIQSLRLQNKNQKAVEELKQHLRLYPNDTHLWYELAEAYGLVDNILGVHQARAQYFLLVGATRKAEEQIQIALRLPKITEREKLLLEQLLKETKQIRESLKF